MIKIINLKAPQFRVWNVTQGKFLEQNKILIDLEGNMYEFDITAGDILGELDPNVNEVDLFTEEYINDKKLFYNDIVLMDWEQGGFEYVLISTPSDLDHVMNNLTFLKEIRIAGNLYQNKALIE